MKINVSAKVFASLFPGTIDLHLAYGYGLNDGGYLVRVETVKIPSSYRMPNTKLNVELEDGKIIKIKSEKNKL